MGLSRGGTCCGERAIAGTGQQKMKRGETKRGAALEAARLGGKGEATSTLEGQAYTYTHPLILITPKTHIPDFYPLTHLIPLSQNDAVR